MRRNKSQTELLKYDFRLRNSFGGQSKKYLCPKFFCLVLFSAIFIKSIAQSSDIIFSHDTKENGLASSRVNAMLKDKKGFYWVSTANGLQRLDGNRLVTFRHDPADSTSLPNNELGFVLMEDNKNRLWVHTESGLCIYQPLKRDFKKINFKKPGEEAFPITSFFQDSHGLIWMTVPGDNLYVLDTVKNIFSIYTSVWPDFSVRILSIAEDKYNGYYWLNTEKGLAVYDAKNRAYYHQNNNPGGLKCFFNSAIPSHPDFICKDNNDIIWIQSKVNGKGSVTYRYDIRYNELITVQNKGNTFGGFLTDASGTTWAYGKSLARYDKKTNRFIEIQKKRESQYGIDFNEIQNMYADNENNIFIMTDMGLYSCNPGQQIFTTHNILATSLKKTDDVNINGFVETNDGHLIALGRGGDGLYFFDRYLNRTAYRYGYHPSKLSDKNYLSSWCGLQDSRGVIWIGCQAGRLFQLNPSTKIITTQHVPELQDQTIRSIEEDNNGNIWMGTNDGIIAKWSRATHSFKEIISSTDKKYKLEWVLRILKGYENDLWITSTGGGLLHINLATDKIAEQFLPGNNPQSIGSYYVVDIAALNSSTYAIATESGIDLFDWRKKTFSHITEQDGLPSTGVYSMMKDDRDNLWFTSIDGYSKIHLSDKRIKNFNYKDGITTEDCQTEADYKYANVARLKNNIIVFGNPRGFISFNPASLDETGVPADALITGFRIFNRSLSVDSLFQKGNTVWLTHAQNYITIQYASLKNVFNYRPEYYYMLEGFDKDWVKGSGSYEAIYTYLPGGDYTFKVKTISIDGVPSKNITSFSIHVKPPFYQAWWFYFLCSLLVFAIIYTIYRIRIERLLALEKVRSRIASDLHDDMGSALSTINILSTMAKTKVVDDPVTTSDYISKISENSSTMMEAMSDIVWSINPLNDSMQKIVARMREFAAGVLEPKNIDYDFYMDEKVLSIKTGLEEKKDLFLIFKEAVNNLAKYSGCKKAWIELKTENKKLLLLIKDDGKGFDVSSASNGNGMHNMKKRAAALKGKITIESAIGKGSTVLLGMPIT
jgi:ligand-binding sensor domain-containing protein/two-component sensor histidine kinase